VKHTVCILGADGIEDQAVANMEELMESTKKPLLNLTRWRRSPWWLLLALPLVLGGTMAARVYAFGPGLPGIGPGGPGTSPAERHALMQRRLAKMLEDINATEAQRTTIKNIAARLELRMEPIHKQQADLHEQMLTAFSEQTVDGAAVEQLRAQASALVEKVSVAFTKALVEAGKVLNAGQRQTVIKHLQEDHGR
jgi:Spy/CpxP family protein refolding chaperone